MQSRTSAATAVATSTPIILDTYQDPFAVGFGVVVSGTVTTTVQHTFDDPNTVTSPNWFNHPYVASVTANTDGNYAFPVKAVRLNNTAGTGTATLYVIQSGMPGRG